MSFILLYGRPGGGKTTLAASMTNLGYKVHFIDVDNKIPHMENLAPRVKNGSITYTPIKSKLVEGSLGARLKELSMTFTLAKVHKPALPLPPSKNPQGYLEYCDIITKFEKDQAKGEKPPADVLVCDSFTSLQEHMARVILCLQRQDKFTFDEWSMWKLNIEEFIETHQRLVGFFKHVIIICHEVMEKDELLGKIEILPSVDGSLKHKIGKNFTEVYHTFGEVRGGKISYKVATVPMDRAESRTSRKLNLVEPADFGVLFKEEKKA